MSTITTQVTALPSGYNYRDHGLRFCLPHSTLIDQALWREESAIDAGRFSDAMAHLYVRRSIEALVFGSGRAL